jgi:hypothetical protein
MRRPGRSGGDGVLGGCLGELEPHPVNANPMVRV